MTEQLDSFCARWRRITWDESAPVQLVRSPRDISRELTPTRVGLIGAGRQARTQLEAVAQVREITAARVFGRDAAKLREFCREMTEGLHLEVDCSIVNWPCRTSSSEQMKRDLARPGLMLQRYLSPAGHWRGCLYKGAQFEIRSFGAAR